MSAELVSRPVQSVRRTSNGPPASFPLLEMEELRAGALNLAERAGDTTPDSQAAANKLQDAAVTLAEAADEVREAMIAEAMERDDTRHFPPSSI